MNGDQNKFPKNDNEYNDAKEGEDAMFSEKDAEDEGLEEYDKYEVSNGGGSAEFPIKGDELLPRR